MTRKSDEFWAHVEKMAKIVHRWPAWKRHGSVNPCLSQEEIHRMNAESDRKHEELLRGLL